MTPQELRARADRFADRIIALCRTLGFLDHNRELRNECRAEASELVAIFVASQRTATRRR